MSRFNLGTNIYWKLDKMRRELVNKLWYSKTIEHRSIIKGKNITPEINNTESLGCLLIYIYII